jgi:hypothetical protein
MKTFTLQRTKTDDYCALGKLLDDQMAQLCFTLDHDYIPEGRYELEIKPLGTSKFDKRMTMFFGKGHLGMIRLRGIPGMTEILIHVGNSANDTEGCILVGNDWAPNPPGMFGKAGSFWLARSLAAYEKIYPIITQSIMNGGVELAVVNPPADLNAGVVDPLIS